jgi:hypothetical protein
VVEIEMVIETDTVMQKNKIVITLVKEMIMKLEVESVETAGKSL